jgi:hypothetical protein
LFWMCLFWIVSVCTPSHLLKALFVLRIVAPTTVWEDPADFFTWWTCPWGLLKQGKSLGKAMGDWQGKTYAFAKVISTNAKTSGAVEKKKIHYYQLRWFKCFKLVCILVKKHAK